MKIPKAILVMSVLVVLVACDNSSSPASHSSISKSSALKLCRSDVVQAIQAASDAGADDQTMHQAGNDELEKCMASYGFFPK